MVEPRYAEKCEECARGSSARRGPSWWWWHEGVILCRASNERSIDAGSGVEPAPAAPTAICAPLLTSGLLTRAVVSSLRRRT
jgi:hypothetical protein